MSDESTRDPLEALAGEETPTTIQTALNKDSRSITPPTQLALPIRTNSQIESPANDELPRGRTISHVENPAQLANPRSSSCGSSSPLIKIVPLKELQQLTSKMFQPETTEAPITETSTTVPSQLSREQISKLVKVVMAYNQWGELVDEGTLHQPVKSEDLTITQIIRSIMKSYHHDVCIFLLSTQTISFPSLQQAVHILSYH